MTNIKTFTIDWDDYKQVSKLGTQIKSRLGQINPNKISKKEMNRRKFESCMNVYNTDISSLYNNLKLDQTRQYYVYVHMNPLKKIAVGFNWLTTFSATLGMTHFPFYVGKGLGDRFSNLARNETHRKIRQWINELDKEPISFIIKDNLTECEALSLEAKLIDIFGLQIYGGYLTNLDEGYNPKDRKLYYKSDLDFISTEFRKNLTSSITT